MKQIYSLILFVFVLISCSHEELIPNRTDFFGEETFRFAASVKEQIETRADPIKLPDNLEVIVIGPGYGSNAANQKVKYKVDNTEDKSSLVAMDSEVVMKRSAKEMYFTAWTEPTGVVIDSLGAGTVDFTQNLDNFIGAHVKEDNSSSEEEETTPGEKVKLIDLQFEHLVAKMTMEVYNIAEENKLIAGSDVTITFPAIKQFGAVSATLANPPAVTAGSTGGSLEIPFGVANAEFYLPPLSSSDLLMYGSFTIMVGSTTYVGTLNNLVFNDNSESKIEAGQHIKMTVHINDDHTALLQAVTLAPWTESPVNHYNRPIPGIWGMEDLVLLSKVINQVDEYGPIEEYMELPEGHLFPRYYFFADDSDEDGRSIIRLYTNISLEDAEDFLPIGTAENPFKGITFDGNGYTISGLTLDGDNNQGIFGVVEDAKLFNVKVSSSIITGKNNVGTLAGKITGTTIIDRCSASSGDKEGSGTVSGSDNVGGLVGYIDNEAKIYNSWASLETISGENSVGGLVGNNGGMIGNSYVQLSRGIGFTGSSGGGFVGTNSGAIENCYSDAYFIQRRDNCGAWVGSNSGTNTRFYWNSNCIDNLYCKNIIGNNTVVDKDNMEVLPSGSNSGNKYNSSNGWLQNTLNANTVYLRTQLNLNVDASANKEKYLHWVVLYNDSNLPVLSSNEF